jgi:hypothetical protein
MSTPDLQTLLDERAILKVIQSVARAEDRADVELFRAQWLPHAKQIANAEESLDQMCERIDRTRGSQHTQHFIGHPIVEVDGDKAYVECYGIFFGWRNEDGVRKERIMHLRYLVQMEKHDGAWKIRQRNNILDFASEDDASRVWGNERLFKRGTRDETDPSYGYRGILA